MAFSICLYHSIIELFSLSEEIERKTKIIFCATLIFEKFVRLTLSFPKKYFKPTLSHNLLWGYVTTMWQKFTEYSIQSKMGFWAMLGKLVATIVSKVLKVEKSFIFKVSWPTDPFITVLCFLFPHAIYYCNRELYFVKFQYDMNYNIKGKTWYFNLLCLLSWNQLKYTCNIWT